MLLVLDGCPGILRKGIWYCVHRGYPLRLVWVEVAVVFFLTQTCPLWESLWDKGLDSAEGAEPNPGSRLAMQVQPAPSWAPSSPRRSPTDDERNNMAVQWSMWLSAGLRDHILEGSQELVGHFLCGGSTSMAFNAKAEKCTQKKRLFKAMNGFS